MLKIVEAKPLIQAEADLGEGAIWVPRQEALFWIDINGCLLHRFTPHNGSGQQWELGSRVGTVVPVSDSDDVLVALQTGIHRFSPLTTGSFTLLANPITDPTVRFNDGKCDPSGRFWVGTFSMAGVRGACSLYRLDGDGSLHEMLHDVSISNGIVWTADKKTMYYIDTPTACVQAFDYNDETGSIINRCIAFRIPAEEGDPDGMSIDSKGMLWIAMWGGGRVNCYDPHTGELLQQVMVPAPHTTSCAFGGPELKTLYITSARTDLDAGALARWPQSGGLFSAELDVAGVVLPPFRPC